jgi:hypothetical protein
MTIHENETIIVLRIEIGVPVLKAGMNCSDKALNKENTNIIIIIIIIIIYRATRKMMLRRRKKMNSIKLQRGMRTGRFR